MVSTAPLIVAIALGSANCVKFVSGYFDPTGSRIQRAAVHRFFTITLPENALLPSLIWLGRVEYKKMVAASSFLQFQVISVLALLILSEAWAIEVGRLTLAWTFDKLGEPQIADLIGPRDYRIKKPLIEWP